jgi:hypothetical protein
VDGTNITERGWGGADVPPAPNVQRPDAEFRLDAFQWGLAALLYSGLILLLMPLGEIILLLVPMFASVNPSWDATGRVGSTILIPSGVLVFDVLALVGLVFGLVALRSARARQQPAALPAAALILGLGGVVAWALATATAILCLISIWHIRN